MEKVQRLVAHIDFELNILRLGENMVQILIIFPDRRWHIRLVFADMQVC